nr:hypothetical protein GCM10017611_02340 [Rhodococcus wratislaviensis]
MRRQRFRLIDHGDGLTHLDRRRRDLHAQEATTDDRDVAGASESIAERQSIVEGSQCDFTSSGIRLDPSRSRTGGDDKPVVGELFSIIEGHQAVHTVKTGCGRARAQGDVVLRAAKKDTVIRL